MRINIRKKLFKAILYAVAVFAAVCVITASVDCARVFAMREKPVFALPAASAGGGMVTYRGLIHSFKIGSEGTGPDPSAAESVRLYIFGIPAAGIAYVSGTDY